MKMKEDETNAHFARAKPIMMRLQKPPNEASRKVKATADKNRIK